MKMKMAKRKRKMEGIKHKKISPVLLDIIINTILARLSLNLMMSILIVKMKKIQVIVLIKN